jgi:hypothetical protein
MLRSAQPGTKRLRERTCGIDQIHSVERLDGLRREVDASIHARPTISFVYHIAVLRARNALV